MNEPQQLKLKAAANVSQELPGRPVSASRWLSCKLFCVASLLWLAAGLPLSAANFTMTGNDAANASSFNSAGKWSSLAAPAPGNTYHITNSTAPNTVFMRTPTSGSNNFLGDSLTIDFGGTILGKVAGTGTIVVTNFILNGGWLHQFDTASSSSTLIVGGNVNVTGDSFIGAVSTGNNAAFGNTLEFTAAISGAAALAVSGPFNNGGDMGTVRLRGANPYNGTMTVSNGVNGGNPAICSAVNRILQLANVNAVSNATLNLVSVVTNPVSFLAASNTAAFNIAALAGTANQALTDTAGAAVAVSIGGNSASTGYGGILSGAGSLAKVGSGTLTLSNANSYLGDTVINAGTLKLSVGGSLASGNIIVASGATLDVTSQTTPALAANQNLLGTGSVNGSLTTAATSKIYAGTDGVVGTITFNNNLTNVTGSAFNLDVSTSASTGNDRVTVTGALALNNTTLNIQALGGGANLDTSTDYVLITAASISGVPNATVAWVGTQPGNAGNFTVIASGTQVKLHYSAGTPLTATGSANPSPVTRNQATLLTFAVTPATFPSSSGITVTANLTPIGGSASQLFFDDGTHGDVTIGDGTYSFTATVPPSTPVGIATVNGTVTDAQSRIATPSIALTVAAGSLTWNGGSANDNWSSNPNWVGGAAPGYVGDALTFAGTTRLTPNMEADYSVTDIAFDGTAGSFVIGTAGSTLTLTGSGVVNNSANAQTVNVPITTAAPATFNAASGNLTLGRSVTNGGNLVTVSGDSITTVAGDVTGTGGLDKAGNGLLTLSSTNNYSGSTIINGGTLQIAGAGLLGGGNYAGRITNIGVFQYSSSATQTLSGAIVYNGLLKDGSGPLILSAANAYTGDTIISNGVLQIAGSGSLGNGTYFGNVTVEGVLQLSSTANQVLNGVISGNGALVKDGSGTVTLNGANTYAGATVVTAGTLIYNPVSVGYPTINALSVSNATVTVNANAGTPLPVGNLTLTKNSTLNLNYNFGGGNPTVPAVSVLTNLAVPGTNITINIGGVGAAVGQFPLLAYVGTVLPSLSNFTLGTLPPGTTASLVNNTGSHTIDLDVTSAIAANWVPLTSDDGFGQSSFTNGSRWLDGNLPSGTNGYYTKGFLLRSPPNALPYTFGGLALSIDSAGGHLLVKGLNGQVLTITNLFLNGGLVDYANGGDSFTATLAGNITLQLGLTSYMGALANLPNSETFIVSAPISGGGHLQFGGPNINSGTDVGTVVLTGTNTYTGTTTVGTGILLVNGSLGNTPVAVNTNATLGGTGAIAGPVTVQAGGNLAPGILTRGALTQAIGVLTAGNTTVSGTTVIKIDRAAATNSDRLVAPSVVVNPGATLTVNNIGSPSFVAGDTFTLFSTPISGAFTTVTLPTLPSTNVFWTNNLAVNGTIAVVATVTVNPNPTNVTFSAAGGNLTLSWPADHTGWTLQVQTNGLGVGLGTNWLNVPGSTVTNALSIPIGTAPGTVFYRLKL